MTDKLDRPRHLRMIDATNPAVSFLAGFSGESLRSMQQSLNVIADLFSAAAGASPIFTPATLPWHSFTRAHVKKVRQLLAEKGYAPATARRHFSALRGVLAEAESAAALGVKAPKGSSPDAGRALSREEIDLLLGMGNIALTFRGFQLRALVAVTYAAGLRRAEAAGLDLEDYDAGVVTVRHGKGNKARRVRVSPRAAGIIEDWIETRGDEPGPLFFGRGHERISASTIDYRLKGLAEHVGVKRFSPHDLRRTFVTRILEKYGDLALAQRLAGHANVETTKRYDKRDQSVLDAASASIDDRVMEVDHG